MDKIDEKVAGFYEQIVGDSTTLGSLLAKIPGLSGYMERGRRREADQLLRETISGRLSEVRLKLSNVHKTIGRDISAAMDYAEDLGRADNQLMGLIGKIKDAPQGYAGFFDAIKVKAEDLARLYAFDEQMLNHTDQIDSDVNALDKAAMDGLDLTDDLRMLNSDLQVANQTFNTRQEVLNKVK